MANGATTATASPSTSPSVATPPPTFGNDFVINNAVWHCSEGSPSVPPSMEGTEDDHKRNCCVLFCSSPAFTQRPPNEQQSQIQTMVYSFDILCCCCPFCWAINFKRLPHQLLLSNPLTHPRNKRPTLRDRERKRHPGRAGVPCVFVEVSLRWMVRRG